MLIDLKPLLGEGSVRRLISHCIFNPEESRIDAAIAKYQTNMYLLARGYMENGKVVGFIGIDVANMDQCVLIHISVEITARGQGVGRKMIKELVSEMGIKNIEAETDDDAVGFYKQCGFDVLNLGEKYVGVNRYLCKLSID